MDTNPSFSVQMAYSAWPFFGLLLQEDWGQAGKGPEEVREGNWRFQEQ